MWAQLPVWKLEVGTLRKLCVIGKVVESAQFFGVVDWGRTAYSGRVNSRLARFVTVCDHRPVTAYSMKESKGIRECMGIGTSRSQYFEFLGAFVSTQWGCLNSGKIDEQHAVLKSSTLSDFKPLFKLDIWDRKELLLVGPIVGWLVNPGPSYWCVCNPDLY